MAKKTFILSDESVNTYGFRILTSGIDISQLEKNPIMLYNHNTSTGNIGRWENIKVEDAKLMAEPVFDDEDAQGKNIGRKVEKNFLRAASLGFDIIETSTDPAVMLAGQKYPTVTKCIAFEASIVDLPANLGALALYDDAGKLIAMDRDSISRHLSQFNKNNTTINNQNQSMEKLQLVAAGIGLAATATEQEIIEAFKKVTDEKAALTAEITALQTLSAEAKAANIKALLDGAVASKKILAGNKAAYEKLAAADFDSTKLAIDAIVVPAPITAQINTAATLAAAGAEDRSAWGYDEWAIKDSKGLMKLMHSDPEAFKKLQSAKIEAVQKTGIVAK